jgi:putative ABC transport system permease protein
VPGANPPLRLPVLAIVDGAVVADGGMVIINDSLYAKHFGDTSKSSYEVVLRPGADKTVVRRHLEALARTSPFPVFVRTGKEYTAAAIKSGDSIIVVIMLAFLVIVICAGIAMLNTMFAAVLDRRRELAVLRAIGATSKQIGRSIRIEALSIGLVGGSLGFVIGSERHRQTIRALTTNFPLHVCYRFVPASLFIAIFAAVLIAVLGSTIPARRATTSDLLRSLADE